MDMSSDLVGSGIPFLDYQTYIERIFFPSHQESPLRRDLDVPESRKQTVKQGLIQLSNLLNSKLFLTKVSQHGSFSYWRCLLYQRMFIEFMFVIIFICCETGSTVVWWLALSPHSKEGLGFESWLWPFCVEFACSPCACAHDPKTCLLVN